MSLARYLLLLSISLLVPACGEAAADGGPTSSGDQPRVVVIPKGTTHVFWQAVDAGAQDAAAKAGLDVMFKGPLQESDRAGQKQLMQQFIGEGVAGIALAPLDHKALVPDVARAKQKGIPVVIFDSALEGTAGEDFASFVATDNEASGALAAAEMARLVTMSYKVYDEEFKRLERADRPSLERLLALSERLSQPRGSPDSSPGAELLSPRLDDGSLSPVLGAAEDPFPAPAEPVCACERDK